MFPGRVHPDIAARVDGHAVRHINPSRKLSRTLAEPTEFTDVPPSPIKPRDASSAPVGYYESVIRQYRNIPHFGELVVGVVRVPADPELDGRHPSYLFTGILGCRRVCGTGP